MHKIVVSNQCGCFKRSDLKNNISFESKDDALEKALEMKNTMNTEFCGKHEFQVVEFGDNFVISFDTEPKSTCCGNGCCG
ncbi:hypothetical protein CPU12_12735 [Malaciobacter molluscorum LMG 25693]|uniref:Uncharacterized protein n=1 Tax=Malaciobacter molluscorum LMG 25693 TaxID=870501 RepID=A0A2G1DF66_9BACT|nr:hypothetical protein [Malaciobacter molluscorum]AXX93515.1 hypothetical protein AMOL_2576 [Malaciobacter molluscorum LMG 25693]PHO16976.1 hypothetical protein CPU12_12735 [Malaciobacter molluscorum LMG 25693]RXJ93805.1 hypothetical protein CRV00_09040 [Malaciobacter molluscorum]